MPEKHIAALDLGTNSFHLIVAHVTDENDFVMVDRRREVMRLGSQTGNNLKIISENEIEKAISIISQFKKLAESYDAVLQTVATSAIREASNKDDFISRVLASTGIKINLVEGEQEARLIYKGASKALHLGERKVLCVDIGGGSTEFILADREKIIFAESVKIGAVRLSKMFFPGFILSEDKITDCRKYVEAEIKRNKNIDTDASFEFAVGTSGTILSVARMLLPADRFISNESVNGFTVTAADINNIASIVLGTSTSEQRLMIKNIEPGRADILPAGIIILQSIFRLFKVEKMVISEYALREGVVLDAIDALNQP